MKTIEKKEYIGTKDTKARRRSNVSRKRANITASEIESGVTLEALEHLNVPIFRYGTQITIHGRLPDIDEHQILGYKSLVKNKNGSIGVRYVAIDGKKKALLTKAAALANGGRMGIHVCSQGVTLQKRIAVTRSQETIAEAREFLHAIPNCFIGSKYLAIDFLGAIHAVVDLNAIPAENLWEFIAWFTIDEITNEQTLNALQAKKDREQAARLREYEAERKRKEQEAENRREAIIREYAVKGFVVYKGLKRHNLCIMRPSRHEGHFVHFKYLKHGRKFKQLKKTTDSMKTPHDWTDAKVKFPGKKYYSETCSGFVR